MITRYEHTPHGMTETDDWRWCDVDDVRNALSERLLGAGETCLSIAYLLSEVKPIQKRQHQMVYAINIRGVDIRDADGSTQHVTPWLDSEHECHAYANKHARDWLASVVKLGGASRDA